MRKSSELLQHKTLQRHK